MDWVTQQWVKSARRTLTPDLGWLAGPAGDPRIIGADFYSQLALLENLKMRRGNGLIADMDDLLDTTDLNPKIRDFYEHTSEFDMQVSSQWCGAFYPFGWLIAYIFSRRLQQLNVPLNCGVSSDALTNEVLVLSDRNDQRRYTGWLRRKVAEKEIVYAGIYGPTVLPNGGRMLKVQFPLPNGNATVIMRPEVIENGELLLTASGETFGSDGFYFQVHGPQVIHLRFVRSVHEQIHVFEDDRGLAASHSFNLFGFRCFHSTYRMSRT
jgi:hypothetical protein